MLIAGDNIHRWPNRHMAFGMGIHRCAGSHLGRAMARELLRQILQKMPDYEIALDQVEPYENQGVHSGYLKIPATFTPGRQSVAGRVQRKMSESNSELPGVIA